MVYRTLAVLSLLAAGTEVTAQQAAPWQQDVAYEIDLTLLADRHRFEGRQRLTYVNHSPDTLHVVFYHLYLNAFQPGSLMAERNRHLPDPDPRIVPRIFELGEQEIGFQRVLSLTQDGRRVTWQVHDTVMRVHLAHPIYPGDSSVFDMAFEGQVPLQTRRGGRDNVEGIRFSMTQWYPKLAQYDAIGWHPHPYVGREFYGPFGTFDVRLTLPSQYVVGATGVLQNPNEVGHGYEQAPDAGRVATGPARRADGSIPDSLTWHFRADRVHDFAWSADPGYIHERRVVTGVAGRSDPVHLHFLYLHDVAREWAPMSDWVASLIRFYSERYGPYEWPQFTVAQGGDGGMEYPMMTLITGRSSPGALFSVTAHELAHMWFYGMVAPNESLRSWIDEGLANYATEEAIHHVFRGLETPADHAGAMRAVVGAQHRNYYERPNKAADWYETNAGFGTAAYSAGQAFIDLLGYVMGDGVRNRFLKRFATEWRWRHPYPADLLQAAQRASGMQLYWLFEQFLDGAERYDYALSGLRSVRSENGYRSSLALERREPGVLPVDLWLRFADGSMQWIHIPVDVAFGHKPVPPGWAVAEPWPWVQPTYELVLEAPHAVVEAVIDPWHRTPDLVRANNRVARGRDIPLAFDGLYRLPRTYTDATSLTLSPFAWYSNRLGIGTGGQVRSLAPLGSSSLQLGLTIWPQAIVDPDAGSVRGRWHDGLDYTFGIRREVGSRSELTFESRKFLGIMESRAGGRVGLGSRARFAPAPGHLAASFAHQHRTTDRALRGPLVGNHGAYDDSGAHFSNDHLLSARMDAQIGTGQLGVNVQAEVGGSLLRRTPEHPADDASPTLRATSANRAVVQAHAGLPVAGMLVRGRVVAGIGDEALAPQKLFRLGAASIETRWRDASFSVPAAPFADPGGDAHLFALSDVGPVAYLLSPAGTPYGNAVLAGTLSLVLGPPTVSTADAEIRALLAPLRLEVFGSGGAAWRTTAGLTRQDWLADAGVAVHYHLADLELMTSIIQQSDALRQMRLSVRFPVWVSGPELLAGDRSFGYRWLIGVETGI